MRRSICDGWEFVREWSEQFARGEDAPGLSAPERVRLPHTAAEVSLHYADPSDYEMVCGYRLKLGDLPNVSVASRLFVQFDGAAHQAKVYVNGQLAGAHRGGYTAFKVEISSLVRRDGTDVLAVRLDTREDPTLPPFGFVIDYLCYGGLYREAWLDARPAAYVSDVFVHTPTTSRAVVEPEVSGLPEGGRARVRVSVRDAAGSVLASKIEELTAGSVPAVPLFSPGARLEGEGSVATSAIELDVSDAQPWSCEAPVLYEAVVELLGEAGEPLDVQSTRFGFRTVEWQADGLHLNGERVFLHGLNRHQSYPYVGYAAPKSLQREDARILKAELGCNAVRTSHYPQSRHFIDACDELGLLVFTELPGWQHIGDDAWKDEACRMLAEMVRQYRSHPSVVLWGVRINESVDDHDFYQRTNQIAHLLDPTRATSGVRYLEKSELLEDVYAFNDFSHNGMTPGCKPKAKVSKAAHKALLISECNGHMYPTKPCDDWPHRAEHARRHARVLNDALSGGEHAGVFEWCMFDYATHKDFGSGDRICYHGVLDAFRNPKPAAAVHASWADSDAAAERGCVLEVASSMDIGDYPAGQVGEVEVYTNAERVRLYKNDAFVCELHPDPKLLALPHPPLIVDDTIGELLESQEGFDAGKAAAVRECLLAAGRYTLAGLPLRYKLKFARAMLRYKMSFEDGVALYGKYVGNWGGEATRWRFDALDEGGRVLASRTLAPGHKLHLEARVSSHELYEGETYDMAAVRIRVLDENNNLAPYAQLPLSFSVEGAAELVGPALAVAEGGMSGCYLRSIGREGPAELVVSTPGLEDVHVDVVVAKMVASEEAGQWNR